MDRAQVQEDPYMGILDMIENGQGAPKEKAAWLDSKSGQSFVGKVVRFEERTHENRKSKYFQKPFVILEMEVVSGDAATTDGIAAVGSLVCTKLEMAASPDGIPHAMADLYAMVCGIMGWEPGTFRGLSPEDKIAKLARVLAGGALGRSVFVGASAPNETGWRKLQFEAFDAAKPKRK
jgi:hypothetical protein